MSSKQAEFLFFSGTHPRDEELIAFIPALSGSTYKGSIVWKFKSGAYITNPGDPDFFGLHFLVTEMNFLSDLARNKSVSIEYGKTGTIKIDLTGIGRSTREFSKCIDKARAATPSYEVYQKSQAGPLCDWNVGVYTAEWPSEPKAKYTFEFKDETWTSGEVQMTKQVGGNLDWSHVSQFGCSNGASICSVRFALDNGADIDMPFETLEAENHERYIVFPALRQNIYQLKTGLKKIIASAGDNGDALPVNVFRLTSCKPTK